MKILLLFLLLSLTQIATAQTFTEVMNTPFEGVSSGSIAFSDVNGDGHEDVLITGLNTSDDPIAKLYTNDGMGNFTEKTDTPFDAVWVSSISFSDVNGDGHEDVLITGINDLGDPIAKLYTNDGMGNFTEKTDTPFDVVINNSIAFSDVNGDGHEDVLITGINDLGDLNAKLYTNDGTGHFTEITGTPFDGVTNSSIAFSDVNGNGHEDVLITGEYNFGDPIAKLYINDGTGEFTEKMDTPIEGVKFSSIAFSDVNVDGYEDVLVAGVNESERIAKLYTNDGTGNFTEKTGTPFDAVHSGSIAFSDVNGDSHEDVLITGRNSSFDPIAKLYINDGTGVFTERTDTPFDGVWRSSIAFSDVNGDGHKDVLITGKNNSNERIAKLYINDGVTNSTEDFVDRFDLTLTPYPNPTSSNRVNVRFESKEMGFATLKVYDGKGHLLRQQKEFTGIGQQTLCIDISSLSPGSYFIQLDTGKRKGVTPFIVH